MSTQRTLIKIPLQKGEDVFIMSEYESDKKIILKILDIKKCESYIGQASDLDLRTQAARIRLTYKDFISKALKALFQTHSDDCNFMYSLDRENEGYTFKWKSIDSEETIINLGSIEMNKQDHVSTFTEVLLSLSKEILELNSQIKNLSSDLEESKFQLSKSMNQLSEAVEVKQNLEKEMFSKFLLVLNEKKRKIREIEHNNVPVKKLKMNNNAPKPKQSKFHLLSDSSEEDVDGCVDINKPGPSTSTKRNSLLFSDEDDESVVPVKPSKIRNRKIMNKKKMLVS